MTIKDIVKDILINDKRARTDDNYLYGRVVEVLAVLEDGECDNSIKSFIKIMTDYNLPSVHTVVRERRYIQKAEPELIDKNAERRRFKSEADFRKRYRNG